MASLDESDIPSAWKVESKHWKVERKHWKEFVASQLKSKPKTNNNILKSKALEKTLSYIISYSVSDIFVIFEVPTFDA